MKDTVVQVPQSQLEDEGPEREVPSQLSPPKFLSPSLTAFWTLSFLGLAVWWGGDPTQLLTKVIQAPLLLVLSAWASWATGARLFRYWTDEFTFDKKSDEDHFGSERLLYEFALGLGVLCLSVFLLGALRLYSTPSAWCLLVGMSFVSGSPWNAWKELKSRFSRSSPLDLSEKICWGILALVAGITFLSSLTPSISQDALVYHLAAAETYVNEGGLVFIPGNFYANFPENAEMLFTLALLLEVEPLANLFHWLFGVLAVATIAKVASRATGGRGGSLAACIFATVPSVALISSWAYVDLALVFFQMIAILAFLRWVEPMGDRRTGLLVLTGIFIGFGAGCKYTGGAVGVVLGLGLIISGLARSRKKSEIFKDLFILGTVSIVVVSPWYLKNIILTGNPLYPFLYSVFGGEGWDAQRAQTLSIYFKNFGGDSSLWGLMKLPWRLTFEAQFSSIENFDGVMGPAFLIGTPFLFLALKGKRLGQILLFFTVCFVAIWVLTTRQMRFLIPSLAVLSVVIAYGVVELRSLGARRIATFALIGAFTLNLGSMLMRFASHNPLPVAFGLESEDRFKEREIACGDYPVFAFLNEKLPQDARVFLAASGNPGYLVKRSYYMDALFENHTLITILKSCKTEEQVFKMFQEGQFSHLLFRWELVFDDSGLKSGLDRKEQVLLMATLNKYAKLLIHHKGTFLYEFAHKD